MSGKEQLEAMKPSMSLETKPGDKVIFHGEGGYKSESDQAKLCLTDGKEYEVLLVRVEDWSSEVAVKDGSGLLFNTVMFENAP